MNKYLYTIKFAGILLMLLTIVSCTESAPTHWVGTWGAARQLVEPHNNPPAPKNQITFGNHSHHILVTIPYFS